MILIVPSSVTRFLFEAVKFPLDKNNINCALIMCRVFSHMLFNLSQSEPDVAADHLCYCRECNSHSTKNLPALKYPWKTKVFLCIRSFLRSTTQNMVQEPATQAKSGSLSEA